MAALLDIDVLRAQEASAVSLAALTRGHAARPLLAACWMLAPGGRLACSWQVVTADIDPHPG
jgi:hypothetical protein